MSSATLALRGARVHPALPGFILCLLVAALAYVLGRAFPIVGGPVFGILLGAGIAFARSPGQMLGPGIKFASKQVLQLSIVLLGFNLQLGEVARGGKHDNERAEHHRQRA